MPLAGSPALKDRATVILPLRGKGVGKAEPFRRVGGVALRPLAEHIDRLEFNSMTGVAIAVPYSRRRSPGRKRGRPENGRPYEGWKMSKVQCPLCGPGLGDLGRCYRRVSAMRTNSTERSTGGELQWA